jgi:replicative DNA helicase
VEYRQEPQDKQAEQAVIGVMLISRDAIGDVLRILQPSDFFDEQHQDICRIIFDMYSRNEAVDIVTVSERMNSKDMAVYLSDLVVAVPTTANIRYYAGIVKSKSIRRQYIKAAQDVIDISFDGYYETLTEYQNDVMSRMDIKVRDDNQEKHQIQKIVIETFDKIEERYKKTDKELASYGIPWLDRKTGGAVDGEMTILAARSSVGKTALALQIALHMAYKNKHIAMFSLEMNRHILTERLIANVSNVNLQKIRYSKDLDDIDFQAIAEAVGVVGGLNIRLFDDVYQVEEIKGVCRNLKNKGELDYVIVDYLQLCGSVKKLTGATEVVSHVSRTLKLMALELEIPMLVLSQFNRENQRTNSVPQLTDLRQSGSIEQDADNVLFLHDPQYGEIETEERQQREIQLIIAKQRNGPKDVFTRIIFEPASQRFMEIAMGRGEA